VFRLYRQTGVDDECQVSIFASDHLIIFYGYPGAEVTNLIRLYRVQTTLDVGL